VLGEIIKADGFDRLMIILSLGTIVKIRVGLDPGGEFSPKDPSR
jgi:hypothetical protein